MKKTTNKMMKKAMGLKGFLSSMSKPKMQMGGTPETFGSRKIKTVSVSPDKKYKTTVKEKMGPEGVSTTITNRRTVKGLLTGAPKASMMKDGGSFPDLNKDGKITKADILIGRGVINKPKAQKGMNVMKEAKKNATPSIPNSYYAMGGMKEMNPLSSMLPKKSMKSMKPKMQMGGPFFSMNPSTPMIATEGKNFEKKESFKKGGMIKKKKK